MIELLKFQTMVDNAKLIETLAEFARLTGNADARGYSFSLPSGHTCGNLARICLTFANRDTGKLTRGKDAEFFCFSALNETRPVVRAARWHNYDLLLKLWSYAGTDHIDIANLILEAMPADADLIRVHVGGEFPATAMGREYMRAWFAVARARPNMWLYAYTKNVETYLEIREEKPVNFNITISVGGMRDDLIAKHNLKHARVIFHPSQSDGMPIDHNDINAVFGDHSFNLLLHGTQPAGSDASLAIKRLKTENVKFSYPSK